MVVSPVERYQSDGLDPQNTAEPNLGMKAQGAWTILTDPLTSHGTQRRH